MNFLCKCCKSRVTKSEKAENDFMNDVGLHKTAYHMEWAKFKEGDERPVNEREWVDFDETPVVGETYIMRVQEPFDVEQGKIFTTIFEPSMMFLNGWSCASRPEDIGKAAAVLCRFTEVLWSDDFSAYIRVKVRNVVPLSELYKVLPVTESDTPVELFGEHEDVWTEYEDEHWLDRDWNGQGDVGEQQWLYTDDNGVTHEVLTNWWSFHCNTYYLCNRVNKPGVGRADGNLKKYIRVISNGVRFGVGYIDELHKERQYFAFHGQPSRNEDYFITTRISGSDCFRIEKDFPVGCDKAEEFRRKYIEGHKVMMEGWDKLP